MIAVVDDYRKCLYVTENRAFLYKKSIFSELHEVSQTSEKSPMSL